MSTDFPNGITSFGVPVIGGGSWPSPIFGQAYFVDGLSGTGASGGDGSKDRPWHTMQAAFTKILAKGHSGAVIYMKGNIREQLTTPAGIFDVTIVGCGNQPRHSDAHTGNNGYTSATWKLPASSTAATPLLTIQQQGWKLVNILFDGPSDAAAVQLFRDGGAGDAERDASHAHIAACKFVAAQNHIEFKGGLSQVVLERNLFFGATAFSITETVGAGVGTNNYHRFLNNDWQQNVSMIDMAMNYGVIKYNTFGQFTAASAGGIDLQGGSNNVIYANSLFGTYSIAGGYRGSSTDEWGGNWSSLAGGVTASDPA